MMAGGGGMAGAFDGGAPCRLSILRYANVACLCRLSMPMSHVEFKKFPCHMSLYCLKPCRMSIGSMSHVEFKKWPCHPVEFKGQGPYGRNLWHANSNFCSMNVCSTEICSEVPVNRMFLCIVDRFTLER